MTERRSARSRRLAPALLAPALLALAAVVLGCASPGPAPRVAPVDACEGVASADVARVDPRRGAASRLEEEVGKQHVRMVRGVRVVLPAEPGLTASAARRLTACRVARSGIAASELAPVVVRARELADAVEVTVSSEDVDVAREIVRRELSGG